MGGAARRLRLGTTLGTAMVLLAAVHCKRPAPPTADEPAPAKEPTTHAEPELSFPDDLHVSDDDSVNAFVRTAMTTATRGDYAAFRLLWNAREEPMPREEFLQGWDAVQQVRVRAVEKIVISAETPSAGDPTEDMYAVYVEVSLDPAHHAAQEQAERAAILVIVREQEHWSLMRAPKDVRDWLRGKVGGPASADHAAANSGHSAPLP